MHPNAPAAGSVHRGRPWTTAVLLAGLVGCGSGDSYALQNSTRVGREQRVITGNPELDRYFGTVFEIQRTLAGADRLRSLALARLAVSVGLTQNATPDKISAAIRHTLRVHHIDTVDVTVERTPATFTALAAWRVAVMRTPDRSADTRFYQVEGSLDAAVTLHGGETGALSPMAHEAAGLLRRVDALQAVMELLADRTGDARGLAAQGEQLAAQQPRWRNELMAAARVAAGVIPRATAHAEESRREALWVRAMMNPDG